MMDEEHVTFSSGDIILEGCLCAIEGKPGVVICHPHPLYGGSMDSSVVLALRNAAWNAGMGTLRFNFRGTGKSGGRHSDGKLEPDDVKSALRFLLSKGADSEHISIAGYSFGARMALQVASEDAGIKRVAVVAAPAIYDYEYLKECDIPKLFILGEYDDVARPDDLGRILDGVPNCEIKVIKGADHMFRGELDKIRDYTEDFLKSKTGHNNQRFTNATSPGGLD